MSLDSHHFNTCAKISLYCFVFTGNTRISWAILVFPGIVWRACSISSAAEFMPKLNVLKKNVKFT